MNEKKYGLYSPSMANQTGVIFVYKRPDGSEVEVSGISLDPECSSYHWKDKVLLGEVTDFVKTIR